MSRLVKIVDNKYVQIEEHKSPNICFNTNEYDDFEDYCTLRETFDPFEMFYENQGLKKQLHDASIQIQELIEKDIWCPSNCEKLEKLQQENKKQKELIDKAVLELANIDGNLSNSRLSDRICNLIDILKGGGINE